MRLLERGVVPNACRIEDDDIGEHAFGEAPALLQAKVFGGLARQPADALGEGHKLFIPHVAPQPARKIAVRTRMGIGREKGAFRRQRPCI